MTVFDLLRDQLFMAFYLVNSIIAGKVSLDRVNDFLKKVRIPVCLTYFDSPFSQTELLDSYADKNHTPFLPPPEVDEHRIGFNDATFAWSTGADGALTPTKRKYLLRIDGELLFKQNCLNLIVGPTGSGKTSMLMALLGEMHYLPVGPASWFNLPRKKGIAYAAQESWVQNETIKASF
jgi:ABC-type multidrug transport system fused ATPase/permease subunit